MSDSKCPYDYKCQSPTQHHLLVTPQEFNQLAKSNPAKGVFNAAGTVVLQQEIEIYGIHVVVDQEEWKQFQLVLLENDLVRHNASERTLQQLKVLKQS